MKAKMNAVISQLVVLEHDVITYNELTIISHSTPWKVQGEQKGMYVMLLYSSYKMKEQIQKLK